MTETVHIDPVATANIDKHRLRLMAAIKAFAKDVNIETEASA